jgi:hypothetical protein
MILKMSYWHWLHISIQFVVQTHNSRKKWIVIVQHIPRNHKLRRITTPKHGLLWALILYRNSIFCKYRQIYSTTRIYAEKLHLDDTTHHLHTVFYDYAHQRRACISLHSYNNSISAQNQTSSSVLNAL